MDNAIAKPPKFCYTVNDSGKKRSIPLSKQAFPMGVFTMRFQYLPPQTIYPLGWLKLQLELQAEGLCGNLDKVWPDVKDSKWLGGDKEGWERFPYFLDGFIPLAYLLRNKDMIARVEKYMDTILSSQDSDGCFYPKGDEEKKNGDIWSLFLLLKVLVVYERYSGDKRVQPAVFKCLKFLDGYICFAPLFNWAAARWYECIIPIMWLYKRVNDDWLIDLARRLKVLGMDYEAALPLWKEPKNRWTYETHVVNIAMALKSEAVYCEITGEKPTGFAERAYEVLKKYNGTVYGHFTGDECLSGTSPVQGSELCGVVEAMYSYEWLTAVTGDASWGDILEDLAFNGLPATVSEDMWTHQYDQQVNQIACAEFSGSVFRTNDRRANMFGLEPNYGCCTANFGQGFPKFAAAAYMKEGDKLVAISPVPAKIDIDGNEIVCNSEYPFRNKFSFTASRSVVIKLRVPAWARGSFGFKVENGWADISVGAGKTVEVEFAAAPEMVDRPMGRFYVRYGALAFSLPIKESRRAIEYVKDGVERKFPYCDYSLTPASDWRYAFVEGTKLSVEELPYERAFSRENPPLKIKATLAPVEWETCFDGLVADEKAGTKRTGKNAELYLQPYGCTNLRITEMSKIE